MSSICMPSRLVKNIWNTYNSVHLHDIKRVGDHLMPGSGDVDYEMIAPYIPVIGHLKMVVCPILSQGNLTQSLKHLAKFGILSKL